MRPVKDLYKPATRPGTQRKGKPERLEIRAREYEKRVDRKP